MSAESDEQLRELKVKAARKGWEIGRSRNLAWGAPGNIDVYHAIPGGWERRRELSLDEADAFLDTLADA